MEEQNTPGELWNTLNDFERSELLLSYEESLDPANLIPHEQMKSKHSKWLVD